MNSPAPLKPHPYKAFYDSVRQTATGDADDRPLVVLASALCKAEAMNIESLGPDLYSGLACTTRSSYAELQKCLGLHTLHSCFVYLRHEQEPVQQQQDKRGPVLVERRTQQHTWTVLPVILLHGRLPARLP